MIGAPLLLSECTSVIRREVFDRRIDHSLGVARLQILLDLPLRLVTAPEQFPRALELARQFQHRRAYDMQHLACAELADAELVTLDRGLSHAADRIGVPVRFLA
jgi:predicted nucleic acid-binding protein